MSTEAALQKASDLVQPWVKETASPEAHRLDLMVEIPGLLPAVRALQEARWGYLGGITSLDLGPAAGQIEVLYHFFAGTAVATLRVRVARDAAKIPSICPIIPSATFYERELMEMMGVEVVDTPNPERLFLPDSWPDAAYPLRKDWTGKEVTA